MSNVKTRSEQEARYIYETAGGYGQRTGEFLFNSLRQEVAAKVRSSFLDTFYRDMTYEEIVYWLENHIVYDDDGRMICLFDRHQVIWKEEKHA